MTDSLGSGERWCWIPPGKEEGNDLSLLQQPPWELQPLGNVDGSNRTASGHNLKETGDYQSILCRAWAECATDWHADWPDEGHQCNRWRNTSTCESQQRWDTPEVLSHIFQPWAWQCLQTELSISWAKMSRRQPPRADKSSTIYILLASFPRS